MSGTSKAIWRQIQALAEWADDVRPLDAQESHQRAKGVRLLLERERARQLAAVAIPRAMVAKQTEPAGECRLPAQRRKPVETSTVMNQNDSVTPASQVVGQRDVGEHCSMHLVHLRFTRSMQQYGFSPPTDRRFTTMMPPGRRMSHLVEHGQRNTLL